MRIHYFDKQYDKLIKKCEKKADTLKIYEFVCHLKAVIDSFSEEDKKKAGKERNQKFEKIEKLWNYFGEQVNKFAEEILQDFAGKLDFSDEK